MIKGILYHIYLLLTFKHNGKGLNTPLAASIAIMAFSIVLQQVRFSLIGGEPLGFSFLISIFSFVILYKLLGLAKTNAVFLTQIGIDLIGCLLGGAMTGFFSFFLLFWAVTAMFFSWSKISEENKKK